MAKETVEIPALALHDLARRGREVIPPEVADLRARMYAAYNAQGGNVTEKLFDAEGLMAIAEFGQKRLDGITPSIAHQYEVALIDLNYG